MVDLGGDGELEKSTDLVVGAWVHYGPFGGVRDAAEGVGLLPTEPNASAGIWMESADFDGDGFDDLLSVGYGIDLALTWGPFCETGGVTRGGARFSRSRSSRCPLAA